MIERVSSATFLLLLCGCADDTPSSTADSSVVEASVDAVADAPVVRCSNAHGLVTDDAGAEDGDYVATCPPGDFCGQSGGVPGWICCTPGTGRCGR